MKGGRVVTVRVNPKDCMAVDDIVRKINMYIPGMSFAQAVSIALGASLATFRKSGAVPERDGFEYTEMMKQYPADASRRKQYDINQALDTAGSEVAIPEVDESNSSKNYQSERTWRRLRELQAKREADPENWSEQEQAEYDKLVLQV